MKFYKRFPGDIQIKTGHLTPAEFGVYDRLLDHYYATEQPLPAEDRCYGIARAMSKADKDAVGRVLAEFFKREADGTYSQGRSDEMIAEAQPRIAAARANGRNGGRPKRTQVKPSGFHGQEPTGLSNTNPDETQSEPNAKASQNQSQKEKNPSGSVRGTRLPANWLPSESEAAYALKHGMLNGHLNAEIEKFRDWWAAAPGQKGVKADWPATWRTWVRKALESASNGPAPLQDLFRRGGSTQ